MTRLDELLADLCPDGVPVIPLGSIGVWYGGGTPSKSQPSFWTGGTIPWVSPKDMGRPIVESAQDHITEEAVRGSATKLVPAGAVLMVVRSSILDHTFPTALAPIPVALNQDMKGVVAGPDMLPSFLGHVLRAKGPAILRTARKTGGSVASIETSKLFTFTVPLPPLEVQREIVRILDRFTELEAELEAELGAELEARQHQLEHYRGELLSFEPGIEWATLGEVAEYTNGKPHEKFADPEGAIPMVTARFISRNGEANRFVRQDNVLTPASTGDTALVLSDLPNGRALARTFYVDRDNGYAINQRVARLRVKDTQRVNSRFLYHVLNRNPDLRKYDNGVDQTHLSKAQVTGLRFPVPSVHEQHRIADTLDALSALVNALDAGLQVELIARRKQYQYYRDKLLTFEEKR